MENRLLSRVIESTDPTGIRKVEMQKVRESALELRTLGFNVHQALALVLLKNEWQARTAEARAMDAPGNPEQVETSMEAPRQPN